MGNLLVVDLVGRCRVVPLTQSERRATALRRRKAIATSWLCLTSAPTWPIVDGRRTRVMASILGIFVMTSMSGLAHGRGCALVGRR
jgi:hypothetical protein